MVVGLACLVFGCWALPFSALPFSALPFSALVCSAAAEVDIFEPQVDTN